MNCFDCVMFPNCWFNETHIEFESERVKRFETYLYNDPEMELWLQRQCRVW